MKEKKRLSRFGKLAGRLVRGRYSGDRGVVIGGRRGGVIRVRWLTGQDARRVHTYQMGPMFAELFEILPRHAQRRR